MNSGPPATAREARDAACSYIREHTLTDPALNLAQYVSLALYTLPPPGSDVVGGDHRTASRCSAQIAQFLPLSYGRSMNRFTFMRFGRSTMRLTKR